MPGLRFTVENGVITRADAGPGVRNALGVQLGDATDSVVSLYPDVLVHRNRESPGGTDLVLTDADGHHAIVFQAAGNKVIGIRAGLSASVGSTQGCPDRRRVSARRRGPARSRSTARLADVATVLHSVQRIAPTRS